MPASIGVILNSDRSKVLLVKRRDVPVWVLPGGGIDAGESPEAAVIREIEEETTVKTVITRKVAEYIPVNKLASFTYFFECKITEGTPQESDEAAEVGFFPLNQLPSSFFMIHKEFLEDALSEKPFIIQKRLKQINYFNLFTYFCRSPWIVIRFAITRLYSLL